MYFLLILIIFIYFGIKYRFVLCIDKYLHMYCCKIYFRISFPIGLEVIKCP